MTSFPILVTGLFTVVLGLLNRGLSLGCTLSPRGQVPCLFPITLAFSKSKCSIWSAEGSGHIFGVTEQSQTKSSLPAWAPPILLKDQYPSSMLAGNPTVLLNSFLSSLCIQRWPNPFLTARPLPSLGPWVSHSLPCNTLSSLRCLMRSRSSLRTQCIFSDTCQPS